MTRVAVVTGAASGIGLGVARGLVADGHLVALLDRDAEGVEAAAEGLRGGGATVLAVHADVADRVSVANAFDRVRAELGPVGILVTSAGIESFTPVLDITADGWDRIIAVNLTGTFTCVQAALPDMLSAGWGRIVTISSSSAQSGAPDMAHYAASKGGVIALTKAAAQEYALNHIRVNALVAGGYRTPMLERVIDRLSGGAPAQRAAVEEKYTSMIPMGRIGDPSEAATAAVWLCSPGSSYVTGHSLIVDGGWSCALR